jgi:hypothetical protein
VDAKLIEINNLVDGSTIKCKAILSFNKKKKNGVGKLWMKP